VIDLTDRLKRFLKNTLATADLTGTTPGESVLLTFDDGPDPRVTPAVLELLRGAGARGVFFVTGKRIPRAPHMLKQILDEGHILGNHTFDHGVTSLADIRACQRAIRELTGYEPRLFRPALGRMTVPTMLSAWRADMRIILWSLDSGDWRAKEPAASKAVAENVAARLRGMEKLQEIVLLHDDNATSAAVLEACLPLLRERKCDLSGAALLLAGSQTGRAAAS
jgi:peptidoglycan/xylan/chitin deacetylase (PgdA/CDA1 family)